MKIIGTGLTGLIGSRVVDLLSSKYTFENLDSQILDIVEKESVLARISKSDAPWVFHFAAKTNVDEVEKERSLGRSSTAWRVNVTGTENIVNACRIFGKSLVYLSTDYVFNGKKDEYSEADEPNPLGWYGITKYEGEKVVRAYDQSIIVRIANPYRAYFPKKTDFVRKIIKKLQNNEIILAPKDQMFIPTFIDDIAYTLDLLVASSSFGLFHVVGSSAHTPYEAAVLIARIFGFSSDLIQATTFAEYFQGRAPRPFCAILKDDKIARLGTKLSTLEDGLQTMKSQIPTFRDYNL